MEWLVGEEIRSFITRCLCSRITRENRSSLKAGRRSRSSPGASKRHWNWRCVPRTAKTYRSPAARAPRSAETKEQLGGYFLVEVPDLDAALSWAARCPGAQHGAIEVRPVWGVAFMSLYSVVPIGTIRSPLTCREQAPKQGREGAPAAWLELEPAYREGAKNLRPGQEILVLTWLDRAERSAFAVRPRDDETMPLTGVFSTRSADRPNPIGIHRVRILEIAM
ncbi:MAG: TrmO family methyltransferase domain-containing protein [Gammaproteobacteria bacterium]